MQRYINVYERFRELCDQAGGVNETAINYANACSEFMDSEIREYAYSTFEGIPGIDSEEFLRTYCDMHRAKYDEEFSWE